jgi:hypothetical protein
VQILNNKAANLAISKEFNVRKLKISYGADWDNIFWHMAP